MVSDRRRFWFTLLFLCIFAPFAALLVISLTSSPLPRPGASGAGAPGSGATPLNNGAAPPATDTAPAGPFAGIAPTPPPRANAPLLAAGNGRQVWMVQPTIGDSGAPGFELYARSADTSAWHVATHDGNTFWDARSPSRAIALELPRPGLAGSGPFIVNDAGWVDQYSLDDSTAAGQLPAGHEIISLAGGADELFAMTRGPAAAGGVFDPLPSNNTADPAEAPAALAAAPGTATATSSAPAAATTTASAPASFNVYWFPPSPTESSATAPALPRAGSWCILPALGEAGDRGMVPADPGLAVLAEQDGLLAALWVDGRELVARTLDYRDRNARWTAPVRSPLPEDINGTRLLPAMIDGTFYLFWPVPTGDSVELHGGHLSLHAGADAFRLLPANMLAKPLTLGAPARGISVDHDVAIAPAENSILVVLVTHDSAQPRVSFLFDTAGNRLSGPDPVEPKPVAHESQVGQSIVMLFVAVLLTLSLWQWRQRQRPAATALPAGVALAPQHLRAGALFIDLLLSYIVVLVVFGGFSSGATSLLSAWMDAASRPLELLQSPDLLTFVGLFFVHSTVGEAFYQRTAGKALLGLRVIAPDGSKPGFGAVLVRNLVKLPELILGLGPLYVLISDRRQRLGDLLGRTLVVAPAEQKDEVAKK